MGRVSRPVRPTFVRCITKKIQLHALSANSSNLETFVSFVAFCSNQLEQKVTKDTKEYHVCARLILQRCSL